MIRWVRLARTRVLASFLPNRIPIHAWLLFGVNCFLALHLMRAEGRWLCPDLPGDSQDYDSLAFNLCAGRGFGHSWSDPVWRRPYVECNTDGRFNDILKRSGSYQPTAYRPPAFPAMLAGVYYCFGRSFLWGRLANVILGALAIVIAAHLGKRYAGWMGWWMVALLGTTDRALRVYSTLYLTEPLAVFMVALFALVYLRLYENYSPKWAVWTGVLLGLLLLVRPFFIVFYLVIPSCFVFVAGRLGPLGSRRPWVLAGILCGVAVATPLPWLVRNCVVLQAFEPLGTQSGPTLTKAYHDEALSSQGYCAEGAMNQVWSQFLDAHQEIRQQLPTLTGPQLEKFKSVVGKQAAIHWVKGHLHTLPTLFLQRVRDHWSRYFKRSERLQLLVLLLAVASLWHKSNRSIVLALWSLPLASTLMVMLTFESPDYATPRFHLPLHLIVYVLAAIGLREVVVRLFPRKAALVSA